MDRKQGAKMGVVFAAESVAVGDGDGGSVVIRLDEPWASDDPIVRAHPELFTAEPRTVRRSVIPATAEVKGG